MNRCDPFSRAPREGAAFLILVVLVLLVLVGATRTLVRSEVTSRRSERDQARVRSMRAAINATLQTKHDSGDPIRLPLDDNTTEYIELMIHQDGSHITARWYKNDQAIDVMTQTMETTAETTE